MTPFEWIEYMKGRCGACRAALQPSKTHWTAEHGYVCPLPEQELLNVERLADAVHRVLCAPITGLDPQQCVYSRERERQLARDIARQYASVTP